MYVACWTRWQEHVLHEGFPNHLECTWKLPSLRIVLLPVFKEKIVRLSGMSFIKQVTAAPFFVVGFFFSFSPSEHGKTRK